MDEKSKIVDIHNIEIITNGSISELSSISNPNQIGSILKSEKNVGQITPLIMLINQNARNCQDKINCLIGIGADPYLTLNYYGRETNAFEIASRNRPNLNF